MIKYKVGDLIEALKNHEVDAIGHQCNCFHVMKSGIAPLIEELGIQQLQWPTLKPLSLIKKRWELSVSLKQVMD